MYKIILTLLRGLLMVVALWQAIGLLSTLFWLTQPDFKPLEVEAFLILKFGVLCICGLVYYLLGMYMKKTKITDDTS